ncbi:hypothetical protein RO3G_11255 [Rhizopus delemar RA 99-880]|uniref:Magnesium transporter n=3 Tax=Rhizopus TaxID=4842 RepID=I1CDL4_RHIO9|nr:hypothetical protein RO3G_11255 [Rhizopus delemar RA 99-880]|eukprot:EIE86544.1 hypothetical protein RO3G_11255 [Rhizopus delemar RA 99-880]
MAFQRKSHLLNDSIYPPQNRKHYLRRPLWVISFASYLAANLIGSIFTIGYLPIVILAPIGALSLVFNALAAKFVLGDPFGFRKLVGTCFIVFGTLLLGIFGVVTEPDHDIDDLIRLYKKPGFIAYFSTLELLIVTTALATHYFEQLHDQLESATLPPSHRSKWIGKWVQVDEFKKYIGISYGILAGNVSSQSMLFAKSGVELIILTIASDKNQLQYPLTWILLTMMIFTAILQLHYLNKGLQLCDTVIMIPISACVFNVSCLFNGLVYYDQWDRFTWYQLSLTMVGVAITIGGVLLISYKSSGILVEEEIVQDEEETSQDHSSIRKQQVAITEETNLLGQQNRIQYI